MPSTVHVNKQKIIEEYRLTDTDTGSPEVQVALLTDRIVYLTEHLKLHKKDHASRRGLLKLVANRSGLLRYLAKKSVPRYRDLIKRLNIRK